MQCCATWIALLTLSTHECRNLSDTLNQLDVAHNQLTGNLNALASFKLMYASVHSNSGLCGMLPASVRYASGFNPAGTGLGRPCM